MFNIWEIQFLTGAIMANDLNLIKNNHAVIIANFFSDIHTYSRLVVPVPIVYTLPVPPYGLFRQTVFIHLLLC